MKWPWSKPDPEPDEDTRGDTASDDLAEAREARQTAEIDLRKIRGQRGEVERIADRIREIRQENHLAEIFEQSIKRRRKPHGA